MDYDFGDDYDGYCADDCLYDVESGDFYDDGGIYPYEEEEQHYAASDDVYAEFQTNHHQEPNSTDFHGGGDFSDDGGIHLYMEEPYAGDGDDELQIGDHQEANPTEFHGGGDLSDDGEEEDAGGIHLYVEEPYGSDADDEFHSGGLQEANPTEFHGDPYEEDYNYENDEEDVWGDVDGGLEIPIEDDDNNDSDLDGVDFGIPYDDEDDEDDNHYESDEFELGENRNGVQEQMIIQPLPSVLSWEVAYSSGNGRSEQTRETNEVTSSQNVAGTVEGGTTSFQGEMDDMTENVQNAGVSNLQEEENSKGTASSSGVKKSSESEFDGVSCPICMDPWTNDGEHSICCLPCGHVFGMSCIKSWLQQPNSGKCPQCNKVCSLVDIRRLYGLTIGNVDKEEKESQEEKIRLLEAKCASLELKDADWCKKEAEWRQREVLYLQQLEQVRRDASCLREPGQASIQEDTVQLNQNQD